MTPQHHVDELLPELVLGTLSDEERRRVEAHLVACVRCEAELATTARVFAALAEAPPVAPSPSVHERLEASIAGPGRLYRFAARVAELLDITIDRARAALDLVDDPAAWKPFPLPGNAGVRYFSPERGPRLAGATVGFLRLRPGARFPDHKHLGHEQVFTLAGGFRDEIDGREYGPGDLQEMDAGTRHSFVAVDGPDCLCLGIVLGGMEVGGVKV